MKQGVLREKDGVSYWVCLACAQKRKPKQHGCCFADETCKNNPCDDCGLKEGDTNDQL